MIRQIFTIFLTFFLFSKTYSQEFEFGKITYDDLNFDRNVIDSNANAVVLREEGRSSFVVDDYTNQPRLIHEYHVVIKIFNKEGFDKANFVVPTSKYSSQSEDYFTSVKGTTYNLENGKIIRTDLDKSKVFKEKKSENINLNKFTLPNIKEGSIIEVTYTINYYNYFNFKTWVFQDDIPKVASKYIAVIPASFDYNVVLRGFYKLTDQKSERLADCIFLGGARMDCSKLIYTMQNIPAFIEEDYMTAANNFKSAIYYELASIRYPNGNIKNFSKEWKDVDIELMNEKTFGGQIKNKELFKDIIPQITATANDNYTKAKLLYNYIAKQIKWNHYIGKYAQEGIEDALKKRSGNVADINLALIAALQAASIEAYPVILSTRDNGFPNPKFPVLSDFDYVIVLAKINGQDFLLDASEPLSPFGSIPIRCMNERGRVIYSKKSSEWIPLKSALTSITLYSFKGEITEQGHLKGNLEINYSGNKALNKRQEMKSFNSLEEYNEKMDEKLEKFNLKNHEIFNLDSIDNILIERFDIDVALPKNDQANYWILNPTLIDKTTKNPFNLMERTYPVDLGFLTQENYQVEIKIPETLEIADLPKKIALTLPEGSAKYRYMASFENGSFIFSQNTAFNKPIYDVDEYFHLKELLSKKIQQQKIDFKIQSK
ncbi:DUF3857 domain-containing protein [Sphingobacterium sp. SRCM116780]|uniref:transglutaminase domain-containing protein n=1 Tax=Sphingobacterium sp. SRCM116780 TaxID=2907623 RepID=UPI001F2A1292|nr:transglutaminase domain-containing protein [Sphingobacterium sp. SRCM116780]UIR56682.1 DUF3857 domain-containing protein [Sphingobacterium sp. SRCM116780]